MPFRILDFVDREEQLCFLQQAVSQLACRVIAVHGRAGIGKTRLLDEFLDEERAACQSNVIAVDLRSAFAEQNFLSIILEIRDRSSAGSFEHLDAALREARSTFTPDLWTRAPGAAPPKPSPAAQDERASGAGQGMNFNRDVYAPGAQFAGRDINNYFIYSQSDPFEREVIKANITRAFLLDLQAVARERRLVLALDHWESANRETQDWLGRSLLQWAINQPDLPMVILLGCVDAPGWLQNRAGAACMELVDLPEAAVREYLVEKMKLPEANLPGNFGWLARPLVMVMVAQDMVRKFKQSNV